MEKRDQERKKKNPPRKEVDVEEDDEDEGYSLDEEEFRLPMSHWPTENLDTEGLEQAFVDTQLSSNNVGFRLLQKMGWKGKGLGKNEQVAGINAAMGKF